MEPSSTLTASARPSGSAAAKPPSAPFLASSPGTAPPSSGDQRAGAADVPGVLAHGRRDAVLGGARGGGRDPGVGAGHACDGGRERGCAAAVDDDGERLVAGELGDRGPHQGLERVGRVAVGRRVPARRDAGGEHRGVLARAHVGDRLRAAARLPPVERGVGAVRHRGGGLQVRGGAAGLSRGSRSTPSTWAGSPSWLAQASASPGPSSASPARSIATACNGLSDERGRNGPSGSPARTSGDPSAASAIACPVCTASTTPARSTRASTSAPSSITRGTLPAYPQAESPHPRRRVSTTVTASLHNRDGESPQR